MNSTLRRFILLAALVASLMFCACVDSPVQERAAPLPAVSTEVRVRERASMLRALYPNLTPEEARERAAHEISLADAKAEAEWRKKQKEKAQKEKFIKELDESLEEQR